MSTSAFDSYASDYDSHFTNSAVGIAQRNRVYKFLLPLLQKHTNLLEINCGTGHDALTLAPKVHKILACDVSIEMINEGKRKKEKTNISNLNFEKIDTNALYKDLNSSYDLLFSNFGGLNCLSSEELKSFSKNIAPFITEKGKLVLVIMGKKCLWENLFFFKQKDKRIYRRNTDGGLATTINNSTFNTYYYSPWQIESFFSDVFLVKKSRPIGFFIPPSYLNSYFIKRKRVLFFLNLFEKLVGSFYFLSNYSDHYLIILEKK
jgi:ubiquinone/menaquinone biosynthesis C-methylase UbiE